MNTPDLMAISSTLGDNLGGFQYIEYCPIEWLAADVAPDAATRTVRAPLQLQAGRQMLRMRAMSDSISFTEQGKENGAGPFMEQTLSAIVNLDDVTKSLQLDTLKLHRLLVVAMDKNGRRRVIGNRDTGMRLLYVTEVEPDVSGKSFYNLKLTYASEHAIPFYEPQ